MNEVLLLEKAVQYLYGQGIIRKDKEIADKTGYNKTTVSSYINGKIHPSGGFIEAFENAFNVKLKDFSEGGEKEIIKHPDALQLISENVLMLKAELQTNRQLMIEVLASVSNRSVMEVQMLTDKILSHNLTKIVHELKQEGA